MNLTPTALLVILLTIIVAISVFGGYFGYLTEEGDIFGTEAPDSLWSLISNAAGFYWALLTVSIDNLPYIFSVLWWVINALGLYCAIKIIWPGA